MSLVVLHSLQHSATADKIRLMDIIASHTDKQEEIDEAIELLRKSNSIAYAREVAVDLVKTAWEDGINRILPDGKSKQLLKLLGEYNVGRKI